MKKLLTVLGGAAVLLLGLAAPAAAHIEPTVEESATDTTAVADDHGTEDAATDSGDSDSDSGTDNIAVIALVVGAVALFAAGYAVMTNRRAS